MPAAKCCRSQAERCSLEAGGTTPDKEALAFQISKRVLTYPECGGYSKSLLHIGRTTGVLTLNWHWTLALCTGGGSPRQARSAVVKVNQARPMDRPCAYEWTSLYAASTELAAGQIAVRRRLQLPRQLEARQRPCLADRLSKAYAA